MEIMEAKYIKTVVKRPKWSKNEVKKPSETLWEQDAASSSLATPTMTAGTRTYDLIPAAVFMIWLLPIFSPVMSPDQQTCCYTVTSPQNGL